MNKFKILKFNLLKNKLDYYDYVFFVKVYNINNLKIIKNEFSNSELVSYSLLKHLKIKSKGFYILIYSNLNSFNKNLNLINKNSNIFLNYIYRKNLFYNYKLINTNILNKTNLVYILNKKLQNITISIYNPYFKLLSLLNIRII